MALDINRAACLQQGGTDRGLEIVECSCESLYLGCLFANGFEQAVTLLYSLVERGNQRGRGIILHAYVRGDNLILIGGIIDILAQVVHQVQLGIGLGKLGLVLRALTEALGGIHIQLGYRIALLIVLEGTLGGTQFGINLLQTGIDKLLGLHRNLVLIHIGLAVIAHCQLAQVGQTTTGILIGECELGNRGEL